MMKKRGQATLLVLLLGLLGLTLALASVSNSLSNVNQATQSNTGTQALAAAEAAAEYAVANTASLTGLPNCASVVETSYVKITTTVPIQGVAELKYVVCTDTASSVNYSSVGLSDVAMADLSGLSSGNTVQILWNDTASVDITKVNTPTGGTTTISRYTYNPVNPSLVSRGASNNFANGVATSCSTSSTLCPTTGFNSCAQISVSTNDKTLRVRPFYTSTPVQICASNGGTGINMSIPQIEFIGSAKMTDGTIRRVQLTKVPGAISGIFDYSLYTEGSLLK